MPRYAIKSQEEIWVQSCARFFEKHGNWDWYRIPKEQAFVEIMKYTNGVGNPHNIRQKVYDLYKSVGIEG